MPPRGLNPGYSGRENLGAAVSGALPPAPVTAFGGNSGTFKSNTDDLSALSSSIRTVISDVDKLTAAVDKLTGSLGKAGGAAGGLFGGGGSSGAGGSRNTVAPVSAFGGGGGANRAIGLAAAGEVGANFAGQINSRMASMTATGMPVQLMASQTQSIFGGRNTVAGFTGISNMSAGDLGQAMALLQQNPLLYAAPGSRNGQNLKGFLNASQQLNPLQGATGAMQFANALTSPQAQWFLQTHGMASLGAGLFNAKSGAINNPSTTFRTVLEAITGNKNLTANQAKQFASDPRMWTRIQQNAGLMGLSGQQTVQLRQFASSGMNLGAAERAQSGTVAATTLGRTTAGTQTQMDVFGATTNMQNIVNRVAMDLQGFGGGIITAVPQIASLGYAAAIAAKSLLSIGAVGAEGLAAKTGLGTALGRGAAGAGEAEAGLAGAGAGGLLGGAALAGAGYATARQTSALAHGKTWDPLHIGSAKHAVGHFFSGLFHDIIGDPDTGSTSTSGMQPNLARGVQAMMAANPNVRISSGHRSSTQQAKLYALKGGRGVARPGQSAHERGKAADLGPPSQFGWIAANAGKYGLYAPAGGSEPWHYQAMGDPQSAASVTGAQVVSGASGQLGTPYGWGAEAAGKAFDCSGLVQYVFGQLGISLPRTSQQQANAGTPVASLAQAQPGDLILYNEPGEGPNSHVAIYIGGGKQIAAPHTGTVVQVQSVDTKHISTIRRIVGGGQGQNVVQTAQGTVGTSSSDQQNHSNTGSASGISNTFIAMVGANNNWMGGSGAAAGPSGSAAAGSSATSGVTTSGGSGNTAVLGGASGGNISSPTAFSKAVLASLGLAATVADVTSINAWQQHEGQWGAKGAYNAMQMHNPLNTTLPEQGFKKLTGTVSYPDWATGIAATAATIKQGNMSGIMSALKANDNLASFSGALEGTPWAGSHYGGQSFAQPSGVYAVGDPVGMGSFAPRSSQAGGPAGFAGRSASGGRRPVSVTIGPVYCNNQQDANNIMNMMTAALRQNDELDVVSTS